MVHHFEDGRSIRNERELRVIGLVNDLKREMLRAKNAGSSLGTSERQGLIQEAVQQALAPMEERLELMEKNMRQLPEHASETIGEETVPPGDQKPKSLSG